MSESGSASIQQLQGRNQFAPVCCTNGNQNKNRNEEGQTARSLPIYVWCRQLTFPPFSVRVWVCCRLFVLLFVPATVRADVAAAAAAAAAAATGGVGGDACFYFCLFCCWLPIIFAFY